MEELNKLQESAEHKALLAVIRIECVEWTRLSKQVEKYLLCYALASTLDEDLTAETGLTPP